MAVRFCLRRLDRRVLPWLVVVAGLLLFGRVGIAQVPVNSPSQILQQYRTAQLQWFKGVQGAATRLFTLLAAIEIAWSLTLIVLERSDFQSMTVALVRKIMWIGIFYALLVNGQTWIPAIIDSFKILGQNTSGTGSLAPSAVLGMGLQICGALLNGADDAGFLNNLGSAMALVFAAVVTLLAYAAITIQFVVTMVESYLVIGAGFIFLGFGGSRWTAPYVERFIGLAVSVGTKLMILYLLIGLGMQLSNGWLVSAQQVAQSQTPALSAFDIMGGCLIYMAVCWMAPKLIAGVLGGSPALTGGDLVGTGVALATGAATVAATAMTGGAALATGGSNAAGAIGRALGMGVDAVSSRAGGGSGVGSSGGSDGSSGGAGGSGLTSPIGPHASGGLRVDASSPSQPSPPTRGAQRNGGSGTRTNGDSPKQVAPPSRLQRVATSGANALRRVRDDINRIPVPPDGGPHGAPPGMGSAQGE
jgi:type IV secretion system protein TrbL